MIHESPRSRRPGSAHPHVKRTFAPVGDVSFLESDHERAEFRQVQPLRHVALEHSSLTCASAPFPGDDKDEPRIARPNADADSAASASSTAAHSRSG